MLGTLSYNFPFALAEVTTFHAEALCCPWPCPKILQHHWDDKDVDEVKMSLTQENTYFHVLSSGLSAGCTTVSEHPARYEVQPHKTGISGHFFLNSPLHSSTSIHYCIARIHNTRVLGMLPRNCNVGWEPHSCPVLHKNPTYQQKRQDIYLRVHSKIEIA